MNSHYERGPAEREVERNARRAPRSVAAIRKFIDTAEANGDFAMAKFYARELDRYGLARHGVDHEGIEIDFTRGFGAALDGPFQRARRRASQW
jgi:hypothetical protein